MAVAFLTRIPIGHSDDAHATLHPACYLYFPFVGGVIGLFVVGVLGLLGLLLPAMIAVVVALAAEALLTGGFHEDALADFFDAFGGGWSKDQILTILKDSRLGTYGALALFLGVLVRALCTYHLFHLYHFAAPHLWILPLLTSAILGRWMILLTIVLLPPVASRESLSQSVLDQMTWRSPLLASLWVIPVFAAFAWFQWYQAAFALVLIFVVFCWFLNVVRRKLGGATGDCLGCICYLTQLVVLVAATADFESLLS